MSAPTRALMWTVIAVGFLSPIGFAIELTTGSPTVRALGWMSAASPLPLVFSQFRGIETFAAEFEVALERTDGSIRREAITPAMYAKLDGPYNRRNTYGAVISYGPGFDQPHELEMLDSVLRFGLCGGGPLATRFGESTPLRSATMTVTTLSGPSPARWSYTVACEP